MFAEANRSIRSRRKVGEDKDLDERSGVSFPRHGPVSRRGSRGKNLCDLLAHRRRTFNFADKQICVSGIGGSLVYTRHQDYRQAGSRLLDGFGQVSPSSARHQMIGENEIYRVGLKNLHRVWSRSGSHHLITLLFEDQLAQSEWKVFIVNAKNDRLMRVQWKLSLSHCRLRGSCLECPSHPGWRREESHETT